MSAAVLTTQTVLWTSAFILNSTVLLGIGRRWKQLKQGLTEHLYVISLLLTLCLLWCLTNLVVIFTHQKTKGEVLALGLASDAIVVFLLGTNFVLAMDRYSIVCVGQPLKVHSYIKAYAVLSSFAGGFMYLLATAPYNDGMVLPLNTPQRIPWTVLMTVFYGICAGGSAYCYIKTYSFAKTTLSKAHVTVPRGNYDESFSAVYIAEPTVEAASDCYHDTATSIVATQDFDVTTIAKQEQIDPDSASILFHKSRVALQVWRSCAIMSFGIFVFYLPFVAAIYLELVFSEQETRQMVFDVAGTLAVLDVLWTPAAILYFQKEIRSSVCSLFLF